MHTIEEIQNKVKELAKIKVNHATEFIKVQPNIVRIVFYLDGELSIQAMFEAYITEVFTESGEFDQFIKEPILAELSNGFRAEVETGHRRF